MILISSYLLLLSFLRRSQLYRGDSFVNGKYKLEYLLQQSQKEDQEFERRFLVARIYFNRLILCLTVVSISVMYLTRWIKDDESKYKPIIYYSFFIGVNATENINGDGFFHQCLGYYIILILCIMESKSQTLLRSVSKERILDSKTYQLLDDTNDHDREEIKEMYQSEESQYSSSIHSQINEADDDTFSENDDDRHNENSFKDQINNSKELHLLKQKYSIMILKALRCIVYGIAMIFLLLAIALNPNVFGIIHI